MTGVCVTEITQPTTTTAAIREASGATYVGAFAVAMVAIPICLIVVIDAVTLIKKFELRPKRQRRG